MKKSVKILSLLISLILTVTSFSACTKGNPVENQTNNGNEANGQDIQAVSETQNPLTGEKGYSEEYLNSRPIAFMVENTPEARPQWGLCSPDIVFETEVEGGITRMMWLYANESRVPEKVGPLRSTRNAYAELAMGLNAILFHIGASDIAYNDYINTGRVSDVDGMKVNFFSRDYSRNVATEHTAYTTNESVKNILIDYNTQNSDSYKNPFNFAETGATAQGENCNSIKTEFSDYYTHTFTYNSNDGLYYNYMNSDPMTDANGTQMAVKNVLVLFANMVDLGDAKGHVDVELTEGEGYYLSEGKVVNISFKKGAADNMLKLFDSQGNSLNLNAGKSWIGFVRYDNAENTVLGLN